MKGLWLSVLAGLSVLSLSAVSQAQPLILGEGDQSGMVVKAFHRQPFGGSFGGSFRRFGHRGFGNDSFFHDSFGFRRGFRKGFRSGFREGLRFGHRNRIIVIDPFDRFNRFNHFDHFNHFDRFNHFDDWNRHMISPQNWPDGQQSDDPPEDGSDNNFDDQVNDNFEDSEE